MGFVNPVNKSFCLQTLCEENFARLMRLVPDLSELDQQSSVTLFDNNLLYIVQLEKSPFTVSCELVVHNPNSQAISPRIKCRLYLDTKSVEVIKIEHLTPIYSSTTFLSPKEVMDNKWALNYFLDKWLSFYLAPHKQKQTSQHLINA